MHAPNPSVWETETGGSKGIPGDLQVQIETRTETGRQPLPSPHAHKQQLANIKIKLPICETIKSLPISGLNEAETGLVGISAAPKGVHPRLVS